MAEGAQPQQPPQLGPGAAARGMKRESELELPVPGGGGDGAEPGLSKRPRTEEAAADGSGGMQVTAWDGRPVTARGLRGAGRVAWGSRGLEVGGLQGSGLGSGRGPVGAWLEGGASPGLDAKGAKGSWCVHEGPDSQGKVGVGGTQRIDRFWGEMNMVEMDSISSNPSLVPWGP